MRVCVRAARGPGLVWEGGWRGRGAHRGGAREGMCALALAPPPRTSHVLTLYTWHEPRPETLTGPGMGCGARGIRAVGPGPVAQNLLYNSPECLVLRLPRRHGILLGGHPQMEAV